jgi:hypothetical protein
VASKAAPGGSFVDFYTLVNCEQLEGRLQHYSFLKPLSGGRMYRRYPVSIEPGQQIFNQDGDMEIESSPSIINRSKAILVILAI